MIVINVMIMMLSVMSSPLLKMSMALRYLFERMASFYDYDDDDIENHDDMVREGVRKKKYVFLMVFC